MRRRERRRSPWRRRVRMFFIILQIALLLTLAITLGVIGGTFYSVSKYLPSNVDIAGYKPTEVTKIISSDGVELAEVFEENRVVVAIDEIPETLQNATIAIEDERFHNHSGVDIRGISRAVYQNLRRGRTAQGGSTITQQLARNIYLTREKKLSRKLQEIVLAVQIERNYSKQQILELYLNEVYYGSGAYGVQTASNVYFGKHVKDLTLAECALLAGLTQRPSLTSPYESEERAIRRRNIVLNRMAELDYITAEERDKAQAEEIKLVGLSPRGISTYKAPWFVTYVIRELTDRYDSELIYRGGLRIHTTLNYEMQKHAEEALRKGIAGANRSGVYQGALVSIDPHTGHIRAMVGGVGTDFVADQFNRVSQARRAPGSAFKTFVYAAAVDSGYDTSYRVSNSPIMYKGSPWPRNHSTRQSAASYPMRYALAQSVNRCAVQMAQTVGLDQVITYSRMLGIKSPLNRNLAMAIGASEVTPLEICSAYGVFAADGILAEPMAVTRITSTGGSVVEENRPKRRQVLSEQTAKSINELLRAVVTEGTGTAASRVSNAHGKTGTHEDRDIWFVGFTPELVTAVWGGNDDNAPIRRAYGGGVCAPIWANFMPKAIQVHEKESPRPEPEPAPSPERSERTRERQETAPQPTEEDEESSSSEAEQVAVVVCTESGLIATPSCPGKHRATFEAGTEPITNCPLHRPDLRGQPNTAERSSQPATPANQVNQPAPPPNTSRPANNERYSTVTICVDSGQIANLYCPETIPRRYRVDEAPTRGCRLHRPPTN